MNELKQVLEVNLIEFSYLNGSICRHTVIILIVTYRCVYLIDVVCLSLVGRHGYIHPYDRRKLQ